MQETINLDETVDLTKSSSSDNSGRKVSMLEARLEAKKVEVAVYSASSGSRQDPSYEGQNADAGSVSTLRHGSASVASSERAFVANKHPDLTEKVCFPPIKGWSAPVTAPDESFVGRVLDYSHPVISDVNTALDTQCNTMVTVLMARALPTWPVRGTVRLVATRATSMRA